MKAMTTLTHKERNEQRVFIQFAERIGTRTDWLSIESRSVPEPDLLCTHRTNGAVAFELVSLTDPTIAELRSAGSEAFSCAFSTRDPSEGIIRKKLHKSYEANTGQIELLAYTEGQLITPDDVIVPTILPWFDTIRHQFKRIWFMGEVEARCLWNAS